MKLHSGIWTNEELGKAWSELVAWDHSYAYKTADMLYDRESVRPHFFKDFPWASVDPDFVKKLKGPGHTKTEGRPPFSKIEEANRLVASIKSAMHSSLMSNVSEQKQGMHLDALIAMIELVHE